MKKSKELKKLDKLIADTKKETKNLHVPKRIKKYKMTCNATCKNGWSVNSVHTAKGYSKRQLRKQILANIQASYPDHMKCKIDRKTIEIKEI